MSAISTWRTIPSFHGSKTILVATSIKIRISYQIAHIQWIILRSILCSNFYQTPLSVCLRTFSRSISIQCQISASSRPIKCIRSTNQLISWLLYPFYLLKTICSIAMIIDKTVITQPIIGYLIIRFS